MGIAMAVAYPAVPPLPAQEGARNPSAGSSVYDHMETLLAVLLALMVPALLTYLPLDL